MKISQIMTYSALLLSTSVTAFTVVQQPTFNIHRGVSNTRHQNHPFRQFPLFMFGGGGAGAPTEDDPEAMKQMEKAAAAMGMSVEEYQLGIRGRMMFQEDLSKMRIKTGDEGTVGVERDANNPPQFIEITITDKGKALGQETVSKELCSALKQASDQARTGRGEAQKKMMAFIGEEMKKIDPSKN